MTVTIGLGWWLIPAAITLLCFGYAAFMARDMGNDRFGAGAIIAFVFYMMASVVSLTAWLVWAVVA
jgi:hypothetical protein